MADDTCLVPRWQHTLYKVFIFLLVLTGFAQMPIMRRYYVSDLPLMGWLADFYTTHVVHYLVAAAFLFLLGFFAVKYAATWRRAFDFTPAGWTRIAIIAVILVTGFLRVAKNFGQVTFSPVLTQTVDLVHLGATILLGISALAFWIAGRSAYLKACPTQGGSRR
jgi:hypothetical protein